MITDLNTSVANISSEALDQLFAETPDTQVNADDLKVPVSPDKNPIIQNNNSSLVDVPVVDLDNLEEPEEKEEKTEKVEKKEEKVEVVAETKEVKEEKTTKEPEKGDDLDVQARNEFLKNSVSYLVEKGIFKDFEGREELEIDEETFSKLLEKQIESKIEDAYSSKKKSAGEYGEAILEFLESGGEPDKIIDLFKERKQIEEFPISDEDSQSELVTKWYKEVHGWKPEKIKKYLDTLNSEEGALESEAEDIKGKYRENYNRQIEALKEEQQQYKIEQLQKQKAFENNITAAIEKNSDFDDKRKRFIKDSIFRFKTLDDGTKVNDFYIKFAEWQNNPEKYVELAEFIMDKEGYLKRKSIDIENKVVEKTFNFVKGNAALNKNKGSKHVEKAESSSAGTDFSVIFK